MGHSGARVAHILSELRPGGVELRTLQLLTYLAQQEHQSVEHLVIATSGNRGDLTDQFESVGAQVHVIPLRSLRFPVKMFRLLKRRKVTAVHSHIYYPSGLILLLAKFAGVQHRIIHFRSDSSLRGRSSIGRSTRNLFLKCLIAIAATQILGVSPTALENGWPNRWRRSGIKGVLASGVVASQQYEGGVAPHENALGQGGHNIVHVGRGDLPTKNRERAIEIMAVLTKSSSDIHLSFVGRDDRNGLKTERHRLEQLCEQVGIERNVHFLGERNDVPLLMRSARLLLLTSTLEGVPGVVLEALSAGLPCVVTDIPGTRFISDHISEGLTLVPYDSSNLEWARVVRRLLADPPDPASIRRSLQGSIFDIEVSARKHLRTWGLS